MVKGISRRVIVVRSPDPRLFEQAIFLMREDAAEGVSAEQVMAQAREAAESCLRRQKPLTQRLPRHWGWLWFLAGAAAMAGVMMVLG